MCVPLDAVTSFSDKEISQTGDIRVTESRKNERAKSRKETENINPLMETTSPDELVVSFFRDFAPSRFRDQSELRFMP
jgi:hypothetical protein